MTGEVCVICGDWAAGVQAFWPDRGAPHNLCPQHHAAATARKANAPAAAEARIRATRARQADQLGFDVAPPEKAAGAFLDPLDRKD